MSDVAVEKINNTIWVSHLAPLVEKFVERVGVPNVSFHSLVTTLHERAQYGGELAELWVARNEVDVLGWASWRIADAPLIGTVYWDYLYTVGNRKDITRMLAGKFLKFGEKHNAVYYTMDVVKQGKVLKHFEDMAKEFGFEMKVQAHFPCIATKVDFYKESVRKIGEQNE